MVRVHFVDLRMIRCHDLLMLCACVSCGLHGQMLSLACGNANTQKTHAHAHAHARTRTHTHAYTHRCGPCRAIGPKIEELAANHADAIFVKIDTEATGENKALAMDAQIRAFPTFHFYLKTAKVTEIVGADVGKISAAVAAHKPSVVTSADAALGSADPAAADALVAKVKSALVTLKAGCSSDQVGLVHVLWASC